jgi:hypothetical protein
MRKLLMLCVLAAAAIAIPKAADTTAWFGTPGPAPLSDPRKPVMKYDDVFAPLPVHFPHRAGKVDELLDAAALKADQRKIVGFSLESLVAGDTVWGRRAATPAFMHTIEWTVSELKAAGLNDARVETYGVPGSMWVPQTWQLQGAGDGQPRHELGNQRDGERQGGRRHERVAVPVRRVEAGVALLRRRDLPIGGDDGVRRPRRLPAVERADDADDSVLKTCQ